MESSSLRVAEPTVDEQIAAYYRSPAVRARIAEYCGGRTDDPEGFSALGLGGYGGRRGLHQPEGAPIPVPDGDFARLLGEGADIARSLADRGGVILHVDIDYTNPDDPAEPYVRPIRTFLRVEPVYFRVLGELARFGVRPLCVMTARGYHLSARVPSGTPFHSALVGIGRIGPPLRAKYESLGLDEAVTMGRAHEGAGRLLEHLAHRVILRLRRGIRTPVTLADVPRPGGGPFVCLDLTAHGDPLFERTIRCAFSTNQKARELVPGQPFTVCLPRERDTPLLDLLRTRADPKEAARFASRFPSRIPDVFGKDLRWVEEYRRGPLGRFHEEFDRGRHDDPAEWASTYDALDLAALPACVRHPLEHPNPALLQPAWLRSVAVALWGMGWQPRAVAGLVRSKYERDFGWLSTWFRYDAATRADFYVRLFCGALACGVDDPGEFGCDVQAMRGVCPQPGCGHDLRKLALRALGPWRTS